MYQLLTWCLLKELLIRISLEDSKACQGLSFLSENCSGLTNERNNPILKNGKNIFLHLFKFHFSSEETQIILRSNLHFFFETIFFFFSNIFENFLDQQKFLGKKSES